MRKPLIVAALVTLAAPAQAQLFEAVGNPIVVMGGAYQFEKPAEGSRAALMLSANIAGMKLGDTPLYIGGIGVALPATIADIAAQFGNFVMLSVPAVTWYPAGNQPGTLGKICLQAGYSYVLNGDAESRHGAYGAVGFGWDSPAYLKYKREMKRAKARDAKPSEFPANPYDVK